MIRVAHLSYRYPGQPAKSLDDVNFAVNDGEIVALVGANGSGKSTLGRLIAGIYSLQSGTVQIDSVAYKPHRRKGLRPDLGIIFQNPENQLLFNTFDQELKFALPSLSAADLAAKAESALTAVSMREFHHRDISELSLGQKQRLVIAEALARGAHHLILDEPTTMIDSRGKRQIAELVTQLRNSGHSILYITNLSEEILLADRTIILAEGKIVAEIPKSQLVNQLDFLQQYQIEPPLIVNLLGELAKRGLCLDLKSLDYLHLAEALMERKHA